MQMRYLYPVKPDLKGFEKRVLYILRNDLLYLGRDHPQCPSSPNECDGCGATKEPWYSIQSGLVYATGNHPNGASPEPHYRVAKISLGRYQLAGLVAAERHPTLEPDTPAFVLR